MSQPRRYEGLPVSEGSAAGRLFQADVTAGACGATPSEVEAAFAAVAAERGALAERLRAAGRADEADIVAIAALIAADPVLVDAAVAATRDGADAATAVRQSAATQAAAIAAIPSPELAERAGDVSQVAIAVLEHLAGGAGARPDGDFILVRRDVAAADLIELAEHGLVGAASVAGGASSHAAIIARGLGIPMLTGIDAAILDEPTGRLAILDADAGELAIDPRAARKASAPRTTFIPNATAGPQLAHAGRPRTADGHEVAVLCNVASVTETRRGLAAGAAGVGLLRTEIPFTAGQDWPSEADHLARLAPILALLAGRVATVRLLDFSGDKVPPFLQDSRPESAGSPAGPSAGLSAAPSAGPSAEYQAAPSAGLAALLAHPSALLAQLRAALAAGRAADLAILVPMVSSLAEVGRVRDLVEQAAAELGAARPALGIMVELRATAAAAQEFAPAVDFFSIGTNDLTSQVLSLDRHGQAARPGLAADPRVLALIGHVVESASAAGISVSVCGDAAADPLVLPLLIGLGVRTVSVPAAYVTRVAAQISGLDTDACAALAATSVLASAIDEVRELVRHARIG